jgi:dipeptidyl aminopeptidase/acylaminoacyl peptidase
MTDRQAANRREAASGWWPSPWDAASVAAGKVSRSGLQVDGGSMVWTESRPDLGGRQVVVRTRAGSPPVEISPPGVSVRSRVHEYGGGAATVWNGILFYVDQADQRWYRARDPRESGGRPVALTPEPPGGPGSLRYADGRVTPSGDWLVSVEERLVSADERLVGMRVAGERAAHRLVAVRTDGSQVLVALVEDTDFVAAPRPSPDGRWLAWVSWDHPSMPWDSSEVRVAPLVVGVAGEIGLGPGRRVAGGEGCSVGQPRWCRDGSLVFVDDRSGWWLPYRLATDQVDRGTDRAEALVDAPAEFHAPDWVLGQSTIDELDDGSLICRMHRSGADHLVRLVPPVDDRPGPWSLELVDQPCVSIAGVVAWGSPEDPGTPGLGSRRWAGVLGSTATEAQAVFEIRLEGRRPALRRSTAPPVRVGAGDVSLARPFEADCPDGAVPGLFFAPVNSRAPGSQPGPPPLVVFCHGGPTGSAEPGFDPVIQFFTSRGLAVAAVDYRGSAGYGREYRRSLAGRWGEADIDDCVGFASALADAGLVDGGRMAIRGTSAGGLTALGALIRSRRFAGAVSWYGVTDLEGLAADTHEFESRYVDSLIGPWPDDAATYRSRSPIHHPQEVSGAVLLLQGADDPVVPADQSERFAARLLEHGVPCRLTVFEAESHGFRRAETIEASLRAELDFYRSLFGGTAADGTGTGDGLGDLSGGRLDDGPGDGPGPDRG